MQICVYVPSSPLRASGRDPAMDRKIQKANSFPLSAAQSTRSKGTPPKSYEVREHILKGQSVSHPSRGQCGPRNRGKSPQKPPRPTLPP